MDYDKKPLLKRRWVKVPVWIWVLWAVVILITTLIIGDTVKSYLSPKGEVIGYAKKVVIKGETKVAIDGDVVVTPVTHTYCSDADASGMSMSKEHFINEAMNRAKLNTPTFTPLTIEISVCSRSDSMKAIIIKNNEDAAQ